MTFPDPLIKQVRYGIEDSLLELDARFWIAYLGDAPVASHIAAEGIDA